MFDAMTMKEITQAAEAAKIDPAALLAVIEVESGGKFFARVRGKDEPLIRFECHYFDRRLDEGQRAAALESVSWGIGQIMGAHWKSLGFGSVEELAQVARSGVGGQVRLLILFLEKNGLVPLLNNRDWAAFARRYNGPGYRRNAYDAKLAIAYARHKGAPPAPPSPSAAELQRALIAAGFAIEATGVFDAATRAALLRFQQSAGLAADGIAGPKTWAALRQAGNEIPPEPNWLLAFFKFVAGLFGWRKS